MGSNRAYFDDDQISISIPRRLYEAVNSFPYVDVCDKRLNAALLGEILFHVEHTMFRLWGEKDAGLTWDKFLALLAQSGDMRKAAKEAVLRAIDEFDYARLNLPAAGACAHGSKYGSENAAQHSIYGAFEGESVVNYIALLIEREHYFRLSAVKGEYSWIEYTRELMESGELAEIVTSALTEAVNALNFSPYFSP